MSCILSLENLANGKVPTNVTAATGYANSYLTDGQMASAWRSSTDDTQYEFKIDLSPDYANVDFFGLFDAHGIEDSISSVMLYHSPDAVTYTAVESPAWNWATKANSRGDIARRFSAQSKRYWKLIVWMASNAVLDVGEIWIGRSVVLPKTFTRKIVDRQRGNVVNKTDGGAVFVGQIADYSEALQLSFSMLTETQHAAISDSVEAVSGSFSPVVLVPDSLRKPLDVFHGRIGDSMPWEETGNRKVEGVSLAFTEDGRAI